jgi:hypothetical protein
VKVPGPDSVPWVLAGTAGQARGERVNGIPCEPRMRNTMHIHVHLAVYAYGHAKPLPYGLGIVPPYVFARSGFLDHGRCMYWLHTHDRTGVIHVEAPFVHTYELRRVFEVWNQPISGTRVGPVRGTQTVYVNGKRYHGDPGDIPLISHAVIQINVGSPFVRPWPYRFPPGL